MQPSARATGVEPLEARRLLSADLPIVGGGGTGSAPRYTVTDIGNLGGTLAEARAVNDAGEVVGVATDSSGRQHAFLWTKAKGLVDLGTIDNLRQSAANAVNASGVIAGTSIKPNNVLRAVTLDDTITTPTDLGALTGQESEAEGINDANVIVGSASLSDGSTHAVLFNTVRNPRGTVAAVQDLGTLGGTSSVAHDVNNAGVVVGESDTAGGDHHAFIYTPVATGTVKTPRMTDLGTLSGQSAAKAISDTGLVVGYAFAADGQQHAALFAGGATAGSTSVKDLGTLGGASSIANGVNGIGQIVGASTLGTGTTDHGFIYQNGQMVDLNASGTGTTGTAKSLIVTAADAINNAGQIVGIATDGTAEHAVLLTPVPGTGGTGDVTRPTARLTSAPKLTTGGARSYYFTVTYTDNAAINLATLDGNDVLVTNKLGFSRLANFDHASRSTNGSPVVATYRLRAPGGRWDSADNGVYTIQVQANQVSDTSGNFVRTGVLGSFVVNIPKPVAKPAAVVAPGSMAVASPFAAVAWSAQTKRDLFGDDAG